MKKLFLYNTLTRKKEDFELIKKSKIGLYTCGPTVYNFAHIGNLRAYVSADILARVLKYNFGEKKVKWAMNITDVDDKTIRDAKIKYPELEPRSALKKFTCEYEGLFWQDMKKINVGAPDIVPHAASEKYIKKMQALVKKIYKKGFAYSKDGSVYFDVLKYSKVYQYGQLVNLDLSNLKAGARVDADEYEKENAQDFVLWKAKKEGEPYWDFKLAGEKLPGRPGWHIECSAMGEAELGCPFDIHTGGEDLKFPHHEDEIAQSAVGYGVKKPVNFWLHNGMLMVEGKKMSKSLGNFYNLRDLEDKNPNPLAFRFLCLQTHYRKPMDFSWPALAAAQNGLEHLLNQIRELRFKNEDLRIKNINKEFKEKFLEAVNDDLNMPQALAVAQEMLKSDLPKEEKLATASDFDKILGLKLDEIAETRDFASLPEEVRKLVDARQKAREKKNWKESDKLRNEIEKLGYLADDTAEGMRVRKK